MMRVLFAACAVFLFSVSPAFSGNFFIPESAQGLLSLSNRDALKSCMAGAPGKERGFDNSRFISDVAARIKDGCDINTLDSDGNNILMRLCGLGFSSFGVFSNKTDITPSISFLLKSGIDIGHRNKFGRTVLFFAPVKTIGFLIDLGADPAAADNDGNTILHLIEIELFRDADIFSLAAGRIGINAANRSGETPLISLFKSDLFRYAPHDLELPRWYLTHGADPAAADNSGFTALHYAIASRRTDAAKLLLDYGAPADAASCADGATALLLAVEADNAPAAAFLLAAGADMGRPNRSGLTPRMVSFAHGAQGVIPVKKESSSAEYLKTDGPSFSLDPLSGEKYCRGRARFESLHEYFLFTACIYDNAVLIDSVLAQGTSPDTCFDGGRTPLMVSAAHGSLSAVTTLLAHRADRELVDAEGLSAFWLALSAKNGSSLSEILLILYDSKHVRAPLQREEFMALFTSIETGGDDRLAKMKRIPLLSNYIDALMIKLKTERDPQQGLTQALAAKIPADIVSQTLTDFVLGISMPYHGDGKIFNFITRFGDFDIDDEIDTVFIPCTKKPPRKDILTVYYRDDPFRRDPFRRESNSFLTSAARFGGAPLIDIILGKGYPVNAMESWRDYDASYDTNQGTALMHCAQMAPVSVVEHLLSRGADVRRRNSDGETALHFAVKNGKEDNIATLIAHGAEIDARDLNGVTPLMLTAHRGDEHSAALLLSRGADIGAADSGGWTALMWSCASGRKALVELLLRRGAKVDARAKDGLTALMLVKLDGRSDIAAVMSKYGADGKPLDAGVLNRYRLLRAASTGNDRHVTRLLAEGVSADTKDSAGRSAVFLAAANGHLDALRILLESGADPDIADWKGITPLMAAVNNATAFQVYRQKIFPRVIELLLANGASLEKTDLHGDTALFLCASHFEINVELMNALIDRGADSSHSNGSGLTMLHRLATRDIRETGALRPSMFAQTDPRTKKGITPLMLAACGKDNTIFLRFLLSAGASAEARDDRGFRAIDYALAYRNYPAVSILAECTTDISVETMNAAGKYQRYIRNSAKALGWYEKAASVGRGYASFLGAGEAALRLGDAERSRLYLSKGLELSPNQPELLFMMACWHSLNGKAGESIPLLEKALKNGYRFPERILHHPDLDSVQRLAEFKRIRDIIAR
jgi:ankyrin repeat protein